MRPSSLHWNLVCLQFASGSSHCQYFCTRLIVPPGFQNTGHATGGSSPNFCARGHYHIVICLHRRIIRFEERSLSRVRDLESGNSWWVISRFSSQKETGLKKYSGDGIRELKGSNCWYISRVGFSRCYCKVTQRRPLSLKQKWKVWPFEIKFKIRTVQAHPSRIPNPQFVKARGFEKRWE